MVFSSATESSLYKSVIEAGEEVTFLAHLHTLTTTTKNSKSKQHKESLSSSCAFLITFVSSALQNVTPKTTSNSAQQTVILNCIQKSLDALNDLKANVKFTGGEFDIEILWVKVLAKCVACKYFSIGLSIVNKLLSVRFPEYQKAHYQSKTSFNSTFEGIVKDLTKDLDSSPEEKAKLNGFSVITGNEDTEFIVCLLSTYLYWVSCMSEADTQTLNEYQRQMHIQHTISKECLPWLELLKQKDVTKYNSNCDSISRVFARCAAMVTKHISSGNKAIKLSHTVAMCLKSLVTMTFKTEVNFTSFYEQVLQQGSQIEYCARDKEALVMFYTKALSLQVTTGKDKRTISPNSSSFIPQYVLCTVNYAQCIQKEAQIHLTKVRDYLKLISKMDDVQLYEILVELLQLSLTCSSQKEGPFADKALKHLSDTILGLESALNDWELFDSEHTDNPPSSTDQIPNYALLIRLLKSVDDLRKLFKESVGPHKNKAHAWLQLSSAYSHLIKKGLAWETELKQFSSIKGLRLQSYIPVFVDVMCSLAQHQVEANPKSAVAFQQALDISRKYKSEESMKLVINGYYTVGVKLYSSGQYEQAIDFLKIACNLFTDPLIKSMKTLKDFASKLSKRFAILAYCYQMTDQLEEAFACIGQAFVDGTELLNDPSQLVKSIENFVSMRFQLMRIRYEKGEEPPNSLQSLLETMDIDRSQLTNLLEEQLRATLQCTQAKVDSIWTLFIQDISDQVEALLDLYDTDEFPFQHARILIEKAKILRCYNVETSKPDPEESVRVLEAAEELVQQQDVSKDSFLRSVAIDIKASIFTWRGILCYEVPETQPQPFEFFARSLSMWTDVIRCLTVPTDTNPEAVIKANSLLFYAPNLMKHESLKDFFALLDEPRLRVHTLKLVLNLSKCLRSPQHIEFTCDMTESCLEIAMVYLTAGYSSEALAYIEEAERYMQNRHSEADSNHARHASTIERLSHYLDVVKGHYFIETNDIQSCTKIIQNLSATKGIYKKTSQDLKMQGQELQLQAAWHLSKGETLESLDLYTESLLYVGSPHLLPSFCRLNSSRTFSHKMLGNISPWQMLQMFMLTLKHIGKLHSFRGDYKRAHSFFKKGLDVTTESPMLLSNIKAHFLVEMAQLEFSRHRWEVCKTLRVELDTLVAGQQRSAQNSSVHWHIQNKLLEGDMYKEGALLDEDDEDNETDHAYQRAAECYQDAQAQLEHLEESSFVQNFESVHITLAADKETEAKASKKKRPTKKASSLPTEENVRLLNIDIKNFCSTDGKTEICFTCSMQTMRTRIQLKQALLELSQRNFDEAEVILQNVADTADPASEEMLMALYYLGNLYLQNCDQLDPMWQATAPKALTNSKGKSALKVLQKAYTLANSIRHARFLRLICLDLAVLYGRYDPCATAFYLNYSVGVAACNQVQSLISQRKSKSKKKSVEVEETEELESAFGSLSLSDEAPDDHTAILDKVIHSYASQSPTTFQENSVDTLPELWTVASLVLSSDMRWLMITRLDSQRQPIVIRIPLVTQDNCVNSIVSVQDKLGSLVETSDEPRKGEKIPESEWKQWWERRRKKDVALRDLLTDMENIIGCWKGLLLAPFLDDKLNEQLEAKLNSVKKELEAKLVKPKSRGKKLTNDSNAFIDLPLLWVCLYSLPVISSRELTQLVASIVPTTSDTELSECVEILEAAKAELYGEEPSSVPRRATILVLDKNIQDMPWESMPIMVDQPISRMPSLAFITVRAMQLKSQNAKACLVRDGVDASKTFYLLNPTQDLKYTQDKFEKAFSGTKDWSGIVARAPTEMEYSNALTDHDLFIYCGHNSGEKYFTWDQVMRLPKSPAVTLLMGCSSGLLQRAGDFEPSGVALAYILSGCPAMVANLWDVTDKDSDAYTEDLLQSWFHSMKQRPLSHVAALSRKVCTLSYLNGAAPVCYGVPVYLSKPPNIGSSGSSKISKKVATVIDQPDEDEEEEEQEDTTPPPQSKRSSKRPTTTTRATRTTSSKSTSSSRSKKI